MANSEIKERADKSAKSFEECERSFQKCAVAFCASSMLAALMKLNARDRKIVIDSLSTAGKLTDETGNMLPLLFNNIADRTLRHSDDQVRHRRVLSVFAVPDFPNFEVPSSMFPGNPDGCRTCRHAIQASSLDQFAVVLNAAIKSGDIEGAIHQRLRELSRVELPLMLSELKDELQASGLAKFWWFNRNYQEPVDMMASILSRWNA